MIFASWIALILFFQLAVIVGRKTGLKILPQVEIPFYPLRYNISQNKYLLATSVGYSFRVRVPVSPDMRRSDFFIPNGAHSDLVLSLWCTAGLILLFYGMWKPVVLSLLALVSILKVLDVVGRKFGYNILRTDQEMSFYPTR